MAKSKKTKKATRKAAATGKKATKKPAKKAAPATKEKTGTKATVVPDDSTKKPASRPAPQKSVDIEELNLLREQVQGEKKRLDATQAKARKEIEVINETLAEAKDAYRQILAPYREACRKAGIECEYEGGRSANVTEAVRFLVEKVDKGIRVEIKGNPGSREVIPFDVLKESLNRAAYAYVDKHLGPREKVGNKGGGLGNRLRAVMAGK